MPQITFEQPGVPPRTVTLLNRVTTVGRAEDNDVVLVADEVSRYHAKLSIQADNTILHDLKSLNGTYVNRQRVVERVLGEGDEIWLGGKCRAIFRDDPEPVKARRRTAQNDSELSKGLKLIEEEMNRVSASMTMIGQHSDSSTKKTPIPKISDDEIVKMSRAFRRLDAMYKATKVIASNFDLQKRMEDLLDLAIEVMGADRGFLMVREEGTENLGTSVARGMAQELKASSPSMGIARRAAFDGEPVLMSDSGGDSRFGSRDSVIRQRILSAMCVPLRLEGRLLGAMYVDTRRLEIKFSEEDLELFQAFANQCAMAIENVRLYQQTVEAEKKRSNLGRFLSPAIVDHIMNNDRDLTLGGQVRTVTTMFCDIRSFTSLAETMDPDALITMLNEHFTAITKIIFEHGGTLDKFVGDEVMALFGAPFTSDLDARRAIEAAVAIREKNEELNQTRPEKGWPVLGIGIGVNTGAVIAGYIGSPERMDFSVLGDHVNIASRLCSVADAGQIVIGEPTYNYVREIVEARSLGTPVLKGKAVAINAWDVVGLKSPEPQPAAT